MINGKTLLLAGLIVISLLLSPLQVNASTAANHTIPFHGMYVKWQGTIDRDDNGTKSNMTHEAVLEEIGGEGGYRAGGFRLKFTERVGNWSMNRTFSTTDEWRLLKEEDSGELIHSPFWIEPRAAAGSILPMWEVERGFPLTITITGQSKTEVLGQEKQCITAVWNVTNEQHNGDRFFSEVKGTLLFDGETGILLSQEMHTASELWFGKNLQMALKENRTSTVVETNIPELAASPPPTQTGFCLSCWLLKLVIIATVALCIVGGYVYVKKKKRKTEKKEEAGKQEPSKPSEEKKAEATSSDNEPLSEWFEKEMNEKLETSSE